MNELVTTRLRRVVPRWRDFSITAVMGELTLANDRRTSSVVATDLEGATIRFEESPNTATASELLVASVINDDKASSSRAANFIFDNHLPVNGLLKSVAQRVRNQSQSFSIAGQKRVVESNTSLKLKRYKTRLICSDAIAWIELALAYISIGKRAEALRAVVTALQLSPDNRFVVRSTVRCLLHCQEHQKAYEILSSHRMIRRDPWLLASQLAVAEIVGKSSHLVKEARAILVSSKFAPTDLSELSASLATTELFAGNDKRSRRLFEQSLTAVTENALAQAIWAKNHMRLDVVVSAMGPPRNFEAEARCRIRENKWNDALKATLKWQADEPFSGRPPELGSFIASVVEEDFPAAERIAKHGLLANPGHLMLLNNLAFAQACQGKITAAKVSIAKAACGGGDIVDRSAILATKGLVAFRERNLEEGRQGYRSAITLAEESKLESVKVMAMIFLAREEWRAKTSFANEAVSSAQAAAKNERHPNVIVAIERLLKFVLESPIERTGSIGDEN